MAIRRGTPVRNVLTGTATADQLFGLAGNDILNGLAGNDLLDGGTGADRMTGGLGNDVYIVDNVGDVVVEQANQGIDTVQSSVTFSLVGGLAENLTLTGAAAINGTGNFQNNRVTGNNRDNSIYGADGNDILLGRGGNDTLDGGRGNDALQGDAGNDTLLGQAGIDVLSGGDGNDILRGGSGTDILSGDGGFDLLYGGSDADGFIVAGYGPIDVIMDFDGSRDKVNLLAVGGIDDVDNITFVNELIFDPTYTGNTPSYTPSIAVTAVKYNGETLIYVRETAGYVFNHLDLVI